MYPNLSAWYLQCYLDSEVAIYLEQCLFTDELIALIKKNGGNLKGPALKSAYRSEIKSKYLFRPEWKQIPEVFLILRKYLLILSESKYVWATLSQWDKYLVTQWM